MDVGWHRRQRRREWVAIATLWLGGCASTCGDSTNPGAVGELGNGRFLYACLGESDPACASSPGGDDMDYFPECIALGGRFDLEYMLIDASALESDELTPVLYVESVNQSFFGGNDEFQALRVGEAAFVVRESERVLDLIHLPIVEPDGIEVMTAIEIGVGTTEELRVHPRSLDCLELGGTVPFEADSSDEAIATVSASGLLTIQGQAPGTAVVTVRLGGLEQAITVEVVGSGTDTAPGTGSDGSGDTGSGTTGGTDTGSSTSDGTGSGTTDGSSTGGSSTEGGSTGGSSTTGGT
jgi:hypothetical protein